MNKVRFLKAVSPVLLLLFLTGNCIVFFAPGSDGISDEYTEKVISGKGSDKILVIPVEGVITDQETANFFGPATESTVAQVKSKLQKAAKDKSIKAVILKINSPGGTVTGSDIIYHEIREYKKQAGVPVVSAFMDLAASGGYYIAMSSDRVYAHPTTVTGSIGVILGLINVKEGLSEIGIKDYSITSGKNKSIGSPTRELEDEQRIILQSIVDDLYNRFYNVVKKGRSGKIKGNLKSIADGRIYTANQALKNGLIDEILYFEDMVEKIQELPEYKQSEDDPKVIVYTKKQNDLQNIYQATGMQSKTPSVNLGILGKLFGESYPQFLYIWRP